MRQEPIRETHCSNKDCVNVNSKLTFKLSLKCIHPCKHLKQSINSVFLRKLLECEPLFNQRINLFENLNMNRFVHSE